MLHPLDTLQGAVIVINCPRAASHNCISAWLGGATVAALQQDAGGQPVPGRYTSNYKSYRTRRVLAVRDIASHTHHHAHAHTYTHHTYTHVRHTHRHVEAFRAADSVRVCVSVKGCADAGRPARAARVFARVISSRFFIYFSQKLSWKRS